MIVRPVKRDNPYAQIDNRPLRDKRLSWRARGILAYLLSQSNEWKVMTANLVNQGTEGRDAVRAAFKELASLGYAVLIPTRHGKEWHIIEQPTPDNPTFSHALKKPTSGKANVGKSPTKNTEQLLDTDTVTKKTKQADRLAAIFNRRKTTPWSEKEVRAWKQLTKRGPLDDDELAMVERYYAKNRKKPDNICRRELFTLLNNWPGDVDKARHWCDQNPLPSQRKVTAPKPEAPVAEMPQDPEAFGKFIRDFERIHKRLPLGYERNGAGEVVQAQNGAH